MSRKFLVPLVLLLLVPTLLACKPASVTGPSDTVAWCGANFSDVLSSPDRPRGELIKVQNFHDLRSEIPNDYNLGASGSIQLSSSERLPGSHFAEIRVTEQPVSPTNYVLSDLRLDFYEPNPTNWFDCRRVRTVSLPGQTATLATGERVRIPFGI
jgi:hypothetical protein